MPYNILLQKARRVLGSKPRAKDHGVSRIFTDLTDRVEVRTDKGLLLFYRPRLSAIKV